MKKDNKKRTLFFLILIVVLISIFFIGRDYQQRDKVLILSDGNNDVSMDKKYKSIFDTISVPIQIITENDFASIDMNLVKALVIPEESAKKLQDKMQKKIINQINGGMNVLTSGKSRLAESLGIDYIGEEYVASSVYFAKHPELIVSWPEGIEIDRFKQKDMIIYAYDGASRVPIVTGGNIGKGRFIYLGTSIDSVEKQGFSRYLFLHETIMEEFDLKPEARRDDLIVYLDWGYYWGEDPVAIANKIKDNGINQVHFSGWYSGDVVNDVLPQFIDECHSLGIRVYCWLELPMVSVDFWDKYPKWREKTATGLDAHIDWRYLMALENPDCMLAVQKYVQDILCLYDWDGVDLAEIYFESPGLGFRAPERYTPMSEWLREDYQSQYGIDPISLFNENSKYYYRTNEKEYDRFINYRINLCTKLNKEMIVFLQDRDNFKKELDVVVTQIDTIFADSMKSDTGVDSEVFTDMQNELQYTLQVEDPFILWILGPERYAKLGDIYRKNMSADRKINIDINVVERMDHIYPHAKQTGLEFLMLLSEATRNFNDVCVYSLNSVNEFDYRYSPYALASDVKIKRIAQDTYRTYSKKPFVFCKNTDSVIAYVNNKLWPCRNERGIIIPSGYNTVLLEDAVAGLYDMMKIIEINGDIDDCYYRGADIVLKYNDSRGVYVTLDRLPTKILVDGKEEILVKYDKKDKVTIICPKGEKEVIFKTSI